MGEPVIEIERYNMLTGKWRDGDNLFYGNLGRNSPYFGLNIISRYNFSENDSEFFGTYGVDPIGFDWEYYPNDPRTIASSGSFTFEAGGIRDMYMAFTAGIGDSIDASILQMKEFVDVIKEDFQLGNNQCGELALGINENPKAKDFISIYPNPAKENFYISGSAQKKLEEIRIFNQLGEEVYFNSKIDFPIDISSLLPGLYIVQMKGEHVYFNSKLMVER